MENNKIKEYSNKYKKIQGRITLGFMIFLIFIGLLVMSSGIVIVCYNQNVYIIVTAVIMIILGLLDIILGIRFNKRTQIKIKKLDDKIAYERYIKIHGLK